ncbi:MAG: hypothetical protein AAF085_07165 [Planctomycetota bacterium]
MGRLIGSDINRTATRWIGNCWLVLCLFVIALPNLAQEQQVEPQAGDQDTAPQPAEAGIEAQEESDTDPDELAEQEAFAQAALDTELASAERFEAELEALLLPDGQLDTLQEDAQAKLMSLATRCGILSNSAMHQEVRLVLLGYQARALSALASIPSDQPNAGSAEQLNDVAQQIAAIDLPGASPAADYWLLIADMTQRSAAKQSSVKRLARVERILKAFVNKHEGDPNAAEYVLDTRLSLSYVLDQRGAQREVSELLDKIGELPEDSPRLSETNRLREHLTKWQSPIAFESLSTQLVNWDSTDHIGKPVLIHVYADSVDPSVRMIDAISRRIVEGTLSGIAVVSLRVGDPVAGSSTPLWPALPVELEPGGVLDQLGVEALPTLAWLDAQGKLASIGTTIAVLDQFEFLQPADPEEPADPGNPVPAIETDDEPEATAPVPDGTNEPADVVDN